MVVKVHLSSVFLKSKVTIFLLKHSYVRLFIVDFVSLGSKKQMAINIILLIFGGAFGAVISPLCHAHGVAFRNQPTPRVVFFVNILSCFIVGFASIFHYRVRPF